MQFWSISKTDTREVCHARSSQASLHALLSNTCFIYEELWLTDKTQLVPAEYQHENASPSLRPVPLLFDCITARGMFRFLDKHWRIKGWEDTNRGKPVLGCVPKAGGYKHSLPHYLQMPTADPGAQGALRKRGLNERLCYDPIPRGPIKNQGLSCQLNKPEFFMEMESWGGNSYTGEKWDQKSSKHFQISLWKLISL